MMKRLTEELAAQFKEAPVNQWVGQFRLILGSFKDYRSWIDKISVTTMASMGCLFKRLP